MCWPTCKSGAYLGVSVFIYRAVLVIITMISSSVTRLKSTYLPITVIEELLLQLIYFIPIFTSSCFIFIGLEQNSFTFVFYSTLALAWTLFTRYAGELTYMYLVNWHSLRQKTPSILLNLIFDLILILVMLLYARNRLRNKKKMPWNSSKDIHEEESEQKTLLNSSQVPKKLKETNILNEKQQNYYKSLLNETEQGNKNDNKPVGIGQGVGAGVALHYPYTLTFDPDRQRRPLPSLPKDELDDVSLPPPVPLASPDYDDL